MKKNIFLWLFMLVYLSISAQNKMTVIFYPDYDFYLKIKNENTLYRIADFSTGETVSQGNISPGDYGFGNIMEIDISSLVIGNQYTMEIDGLGYIPVNSEFTAQNGGVINVDILPYFYSGIRFIYIDEATGARIGSGDRVHWGVNTFCSDQNFDIVIKYNSFPTISTEGTADIYDCFFGRFLQNIEFSGAWLPEYDFERATLIKRDGTEEPLDLWGVIDAPYLLSQLNINNLVEIKCYFKEQLKQSSKLTDHLILETADDYLFEVKQGEYFNVYAWATRMNDLRIGLFNNTTGAFIQDIVQSVSGNKFTCKAPTITRNQYMICPYYVDNDGSIKRVERQANTPWVDILPLYIQIGSLSTMSMDVTNNISATQNMRLIGVPTANSHLLTWGDQFNVMMPLTQQQGVQFGAFSRLGDFEDDILLNQLAGPQYRCEISYYLYGEYIVMPYIIENGMQKIIERSPGATVIDRLPIKVDYIARAARSATADVKESETDIQVSLSPNPVVDMLNIESGEGVNSIQVFDINNRQVLNIANPASSIDLSTLTNGLYIVKVTTESGVKSFKVFKK